jgi:hypothetical protein
VFEQPAEKNVWTSPKRDEVTKDWGKLHDLNLQNLFLPSDTLIRNKTKRKKSSRNDTGKTNKGSM